MAPRALMAQRTGRGRRPGTLFPRTTRRGRTGRRRRARSSRRRGSFSDAILRERLSRSWRAPRPSLSRSWRCSRSSLCELFLRTNSAPPPGSRRAVPSMRAARLSGVGRGRRRCGMCGRSMRGCGRGALRQTRSGARLPGGSWPRLASALGALGGWPLPWELHSFLCPDVAAVTVPLSRGGRGARRTASSSASEPPRTSRCTCGLRSHTHSTFRVPNAFPPCSLNLRT